jgi:hypothetical protein
MSVILDDYWRALSLSQRSDFSSSGDQVVLEFLGLGDPLVVRNDRKFIKRCPPGRATFTHTPRTLFLKEFSIVVILSSQMDSGATVWQVGVSVKRKERVSVISSTDFCGGK